MKLIPSLFTILFILSLSQAAFSQGITERKQAKRTTPGSGVMFDPQPEPPGEPARQMAAAPSTPASRGSEVGFDPQPEPPGRRLMVAKGPSPVYSEKMIIDDNRIQFIPATAGEKAALIFDGKPYVRAPGMDTGAVQGGPIICRTLPGGKGYLINNRPYAPTTNANAPGVFMILGKAYVPAGETADEPLWKSKSE